MKYSSKYELHRNNCVSFFDYFWLNDRRVQPTVCTLQLHVRCSSAMHERIDNSLHTISAVWNSCGTETSTINNYSEIISMTYKWNTRKSSFLQGRTNVLRSTTIERWISFDRYWSIIFRYIFSIVCPNTYIICLPIHKTAPCGHFILYIVQIWVIFVSSTEKSWWTKDQS